MSDAAFLRMVVCESLREALGTAPTPIEQERSSQAIMGRIAAVYGGETVSVYVPKIPGGLRAERAREIRALWPGRNAAFLAARYGLSERQVRRIVSTKSDG